MKLQSVFRIVFSVVTAFLLFQSNSYPQTPATSPKPSDFKIEWDEPHSGGTLGGFLEPAYKQILTECGISSLVHEVKRKKGFGGKEEIQNIQLSSIPRILQKNLQLTLPVWTQSTESIGKIFAYIYPNEDITTFRFDNKWLLYKNNLGADPSSMLPTGGTSVIYAHNCSGIVSAAANASTGTAIPFASLKAALDTEYSGTRKRMLALVAGRFSSPFGDLLNSPVTSADRLAALLTLWEWYSKFPEEVGKPHYIVTSFNGAALFELFEQKRNIEGRVAASASLGIPYFSLDARIQAAISESNKTEINKYSTAAYLQSDRKPDLITKPVLEPEQIKSTLSTFSSRLVPGYYSTLVPKTPSAHTQRLEGVPNRLCDVNNWDIQTDDSIQGKLKLSSASVGPLKEDNKEVSTCDLNVSYEPSDQVFQGSGRVELKYKIKTISTIKGQSLILQAEPVVYATSHSPELVERSTNMRYRFKVVGDGNILLTWDNVDVTVLDDEGILDGARDPIANNLQIVCGQERKPITVTAQPVKLTLADRKAQMSFDYLADRVENLNIEKIDDAEKCNLIGTLRFYRKAQGTTVERPLPRIPVFFPRVKPPVAPPQPQEKPAEKPPEKPPENK